MTKKNILIIALVLFLGGLSLYFNRDWFSSEVIQVSHRSISPRGWMTRGPGATAPANPVVFLIDKELKLTSVKVVVVSDAETNKYPHAIWNLVSDSNSIPTKEFIYGTPIRGMRLAVKGVGPDPLEPGLNYRLLIEAGSTKLGHDFVPVPRTQ
jgi:hypothetical protein